MSFGNATDNLFGLAELDFPPLPSRAKIMMTFLERPSISGSVEIMATHDETRLRGTSLEIQGALRSDLKPADLDLSSWRYIGFARDSLGEWLWFSCLNEGIKF